MMYLVSGSTDLCPACSTRLSLLADDLLASGYPAFLICWTCQDATQIKGDDGQRVVYKEGRKRKFIPPNREIEPCAKKKRLKNYRKRERE